MYNEPFSIRCSTPSGHIASSRNFYKYVNLSGSANSLVNNLLSLKPYNILSPNGTKYLNDGQSPSTPNPTLIKVLKGVNRKRQGDTSIFEVN